MQTFYDILKKKANDSKIRNKIALVGKISYIDFKCEYHSVSYLELLSLVDAYIKEYKNPRHLLLRTEKKVYIVVDNSINSIAAIIALLKLGFMPVIIDFKYFDIESDAVLPALCKERYALENELDLNKQLKRYLSKVENHDEILPHEKEEVGKIIICSSGTEGDGPHFHLIKEEDLIKNRNKYGEDNSNFFSYISCANISGLLTNLVNPIVRNCTTLLSQDFNLDRFYFYRFTENFGLVHYDEKYEEKIFNISPRDPRTLDFIFDLVSDSSAIMHQNNEYTRFDRQTNAKTTITVGPNNSPQIFDFFRFRRQPADIVVSGNKLKVIYTRLDYALPTIDASFLKSTIMPESIMFPRDILEYLARKDLSKINLRTIKHIYLAGGINSEEMIQKIRKMIPSIKKDVFVNLYGATEANGVICSCREKDLKTCYINLTNYENGEVIYTFDKKTFYRLKCGQKEQIDAEYNEFEFVPYLNVSSKRVGNVSIDSQLNILLKDSSNEAINTGDMGIYINDCLYVLGRKRSLVRLNNKAYFLNSLETYFSNLLNLEVHALKDENNDALELYVHLESKKDVNYYLSTYKNILNLIKEFKHFKIELPVLLNDHVFPRSRVSGKVAKKKLRPFKKYAAIQYNSISNYPNSMKELTRKIFKKYFPSYAIGEIDDDFCFTVSLGNNYFFPINNNTDHIFETISFDDEKIKFRIKPNILFATEEELDQDLVKFEAFKTSAMGMASAIGELFIKEYQSSYKHDENFHSDDPMEVIKYLQYAAYFSLEEASTGEKKLWKK